MIFHLNEIRLIDFIFRYSNYKLKKYCYYKIIKNIEI